MSENDRLALEVSKELEYAIAQLKNYSFTSEQFLQRLRFIMKAGNL